MFSTCAMRRTPSDNGPSGVTWSSTRRASYLPAISDAKITAFLAWSDPSVGTRIVSNMIASSNRSSLVDCRDRIDEAAVAKPRLGVLPMAA
jgi:hypothetical protein